jgi:hypothetical protein
MVLSAYLPKFFSSFAWLLTYHFIMLCSYPLVWGTGVTAGAVVLETSLGHHLDKGGTHLPVTTKLASSTCSLGLDLGRPAETAVSSCGLCAPWINRSLKDTESCPSIDVCQRVGAVVSRRRAGVCASNQDILRCSWFLVVCTNCQKNVIAKWSEFTYPSHSL